MASQMRQPSPPNGIHPHHLQPGPHMQTNGHINYLQQPPHPSQQPQQQQQQQQVPPPPQQQLQPQGPPGKITPQYLAQANEQIWISLGSLSELMSDYDGAIHSYEQALRHNQYSIPAMTSISSIFRTKEQFPRAVEYLQIILKLEPGNGEVWGSLGHCFLMMEDLQQAYSAYQQALYHLRNPQEPKLWYGIGILYDRYGSLDHAEEAFSQVMKMQPDFEKANEIYFRLGIIYKQQQKFNQSLECFRYIVHDPPRPLTEEDIWFQIGHVHEQQKDYDSAKQAYRRVLEHEPDHAKVLQQLGWLYHQASNSFQSQDQAIQYLEKSVKSDGSDAQSWYLLGRCYMSQNKFSKAYEAYQQAVYRDGRNPTFWCSIGVLYYQINQFRDALDAYSRAIRLNPYISEVWYDLGTLYESCNNQTTDALDAYQRAADLDPNNVHIKARLALLRTNQAQGITSQHSAPAPQDIHPQHYQAPGVGAPPGPQWGLSGPAQLTQQNVGPPPPEWDRRLAAMDPQPQPQPQTHLPYNQRDALRVGIGHRQPSPRHEQQLRQYQEPPRNLPGPPPRRLTPPPPPPAGSLQSLSHPPANPYPGPQGLPQPVQLQPQQAPPTRITNPNYGTPNVGIPPPHMASHGQPTLPPGRGMSPSLEIRPLNDDRIRSPATGHLPPFGHREHADSVHQPRMMGGGPTSIPGDHAPHREREESRPLTGIKRVNDSDEAKHWNKKPASDENRGRLEDRGYRRDSPRDRPVSPPRHMRRSSSEIRREEQRRANENYYPSEAAHHPQPVMPMPMPHQQQQQQQQPPPPPPPPPPSHSTPGPQQSQLPPPPQMPEAQQQQQPPPQQQQAAHLIPLAEATREEGRRETYEPAARKMEINEDYDDDGPEEKRVGSGGRTSPQQGQANGPTKGEGQ